MLFIAPWKWDAHLKTKTTTASTARATATAIATATETKEVKHFIKNISHCFTFVYHFISHYFCELKKNWLYIVYFLLWYAAATDVAAWLLFLKQERFNLAFVLYMYVAWVCMFVWDREREWQWDTMIEQMTHRKEIRKMMRRNNAWQKQIVQQWRKSVYLWAGFAYFIEFQLFFFVMLMIRQITIENTQCKNYLTETNEF